MSKDNPDNSRRKFLSGSLTLVGGTGAAATLWPFLSSMAPSAKAKASGASVEVDISNLEEGQKIDLIWRKKPVWIVKRTKSMLDSIDTNEGKYKDPMSENIEQQPEFAKNKFRSLKPEILVLEGVCTHLGCNPAYKPDRNNGELGKDWQGGFFCACHGSKFDLAGKVESGSPAGANLKVPPYRFVDENTIIVGELPTNDEKSKG
ncbi:MAG: ubiquinol-cytochrome c reductase iron-sulfur subunit [Gammaproteobacteria bacterium]|jgi:ubiquinol-cytochrome c reductase iron-sulfur subunit|nr:ubiquinol-cytochrome c reductase iron-sulfur subunit [Gammaproteobacteria bacterium]MBT7603038.1 ubiquinol-cytochrome c reductase iron-sulfur subunit [Gammaproteobacteria bacterium]